MRRFVASSWCLAALFCSSLLGSRSAPALAVAARAEPASHALVVEVPEEGVLEGWVRTVEGEPVPQLVLVLEGPSGSRVVVTGAQGRYRAAALAAGRYRIAPRSRSVELVAAAAADSASPADGAAGAETASSAGPAAGAAADARAIRLDLMLQPAPIAERIVVVATRGEALATTSGLSTVVLDREAILDRHAASMLDLLGGLPGVATARTGGIGSQGSIFVRGGESDMVRILVDGVPVNEPGGAYDFGTALPLELERVELARGAGSALYGTDALAGTLQLVTRRGDSATPLLRLEAEGGSSDWARGLVGGSGAGEHVDWNLGLQRLETDNDTPNNELGSDVGAVSFGSAVSDSISLRATLRAGDNRVGRPGPVRFGRPDLDAFVEREDLVTGANGSIVRGSVEHELRAGWSAIDELSVDPLDSGPYVPRFGDRVSSLTAFDFVNPEGFQNDTERWSAGYRAELTAGARQILTAGVDAERETGELGDRRAALLEPERENWGIYLQDRVLLGDRVFLTAGGRLEDNQSFGRDFTPRVAVAWENGSGRRVLRASAGAGIKEPGLFESFGISFFARGNPDLEPEESRTYEVGLAQRLAGRKLRLDAALFQHEYRHQIAFDVLDFETFEGSFVNLGETRARGLELWIESKPSASLRVVSSYTWLDGEILVSGNAFSPIFAAGRSLQRRPEHEGSVLLEGDAGRFHPGARLLVVGARTDTDFAGLDLESSPSYARLDLRLRVELGRGIDLIVGCDNALDEDYDEAMGFPALGRAVRGGLTARFGGG